MKKRNLLHITTALLVSVIASPLFALDTTEPFDKGVSDVEFYGSVGGIGGDEGSRAYGGEYLIGTGLTDNFSIHFAYTVESNEYFGAAAQAGSFNLFYNIIDSDRFKFDMMGCFDGALAIGTEFNLDFDGTGLQFHLEEGLAETSNDNGEAEIGFTTTIAPLAYYNLSESMQLLAGIDFSIDHSADEDATDIGAAAVGFNVGVTETIELISEVSVDIPKDDEKTTVGFSIGFIATVL